MATAGIIVYDVKGQVMYDATGSSKSLYLIGEFSVPQSIIPQKNSKGGSYTYYNSNIIPGSIMIVPKADNQIVAGYSYGKYKEKGTGEIQVHLTISTGSITLTGFRGYPTSTKDNWQVSKTKTFQIWGIRK